MKTSVLLVAILLVASPVFAQRRLPANMVSVSTGVFTRITGTATVENALEYLDAHDGPVSQTNYAPRCVTNRTPTAYTPRWNGDILEVYGTNAAALEVWQSWGVTTSTWAMIYPVQCQVSTNTTATNVAPRAIGDRLLIHAATNTEYVSWDGTTWTVR